MGLIFIIFVKFSRASILAKFIIMIVANLMQLDLIISSVPTDTFYELGGPQNKYFR